MFESFNGTFTSYTADGITSVEDPGKRVNQLKEWLITILATEYTITANEDYDITFENSLIANGNYTVNFMTRAFLVTLEDELEDTIKFPNTLVNNKINITARHLEKKIKAHFRNLYTLYPNDDDPMDRIINLHEVQIAFGYYCLAKCYSDTTLINDDMNVWNEEKNMNSYKELIKDCINLLAIDSDDNGALDNEDKSNNVGKGVILQR